jgi:eukaryotic-like serine/threonine-protein kinase
VVVGTSVGHYRVLGKLGQGGMGEVYRARDSKLNREVALKVLPAAVAADADRLARFRREAQVLAALNHPNIAHIHGLEEFPGGGERSGSVALVMELVDGEDLAVRLGRQPMAWADVKPIALQIVAALEAAHEAGIVHRDLKPANIKVRDDGTVKVLDFGLAKAIASGVGRPESAPGREDGASHALANSPTITTPAMTEAGIVLGTAAYMSPEQAKGRPVDKRTDVWAFGCVLYEMLTGARAFAGEDVSDTLAAILRSDPDWSRVPGDVPAPVRQLLQGCLDKDSRTRVPDIAVARYVLEERLGAGATPVAAPAGAGPSRRAFRAIVAAAFVLGALLAAAAAALWPSREVAPPPTGRFLAVPDPPLVPPRAGGALAIDPLARFLVYVAGTPGAETYLALRPLGQLTGSRLAGTEGGRSPFVSPDGQWVGFFSGGLLKKVSVTGGAPVTLCRIDGIQRGATWGEDGTIVFATSVSRGLLQVSAQGGEPKAITNEVGDAASPLHVNPSFLPGGKALLFNIYPRLSSQATVAHLALSTGAVSTLPRIEGGAATYVDSGHIVFTSGGELRAAPFDRQRNTVQGDAVTVMTLAAGVTETIPGHEREHSFAVSRNGVLVHFQALDARSGAGDRTVVWVDRKGTETPAGLPPRAYETVRLAPDGRHLAVDARDRDRDVWIWDIARTTLTRLTIGPADEQGPVWSPDGRFVYFSSTRGGIPNVSRQRANGVGEVETLTLSGMPCFITSMASDGRFVLFRVNAQGADIAIASALEAGVPLRDEQVEVILPSGGHALYYGAEISPDGRWLAQHSNESGQFEVYVRPFPNVAAGRWQVSTSGGTRAAWSPDGGELYYLDGDNLLTTVSVSAAGDTFSAGPPVRLLQTSYVAGSTVRGLDLRGYDVAADGRFLMIKDGLREGRAPLVSIVVVTNWLDELRQRVPASR